MINEVEKIRGVLKGVWYWFVLVLYIVISFVWFVLVMEVDMNIIYII